MKSRVESGCFGALLMGALTFGGSAANGLATQEPASAERPNIIVIVTDDWGRGDMGVSGVLDDIRTPNVDELARSGANFSSGYITSPQCAPSRVAILTGRNQQRFGFDNINNGPLASDVRTIADRLQDAGYLTCMVGKWHLEPSAATVDWARSHHPELVKDGKITSLPFSHVEPYYPHHYGFEYYYVGNQSPYYANFDLSGRLTRPGWAKLDTHRVDAKTDAALGFIKAHQQSDRPFFLYLAYFAPHVPLDAPQSYLDRFPGEMPERRRQGLALMSAVDDGVGKIVGALEAAGQSEKTLIFFISDNGAPLGAHQGEPMEDALPVDKPGPAWCGSRNDPFLGEKGMLAEGGIRVPFIAAWPGTIPAAQVFGNPVISLDIAATANAVAGLPDDPELDGVNLIPFLTGRRTEPPHQDLCWKFWNQAAIRAGDWKFIQAGKNRRLLFNLEDDPEEKQNVHDRHPEKAQEMRERLAAWITAVSSGSMPVLDGNEQEVRWFEWYFGHNPTGAPSGGATGLPSGWTGFQDDFSRGPTGPTSEGAAVGDGYQISSVNQPHGSLQIRHDSITGSGITGLRNTVLSYETLELNSDGFVVAADMLLTRSGDRSIGLVFNFQNRENFYMARIRQNQLHIRRMVQGHETNIADHNNMAEIELDRWFRLAVASEQPHEFTVTLMDAESGEPLWEERVTDHERAFTGGYGGLVLCDNHADPRIRNLSISTLAP